MNVTPPRKPAKRMTYNNERRMGAKYKREEHANEARFARWESQEPSRRDPAETDIFETKVLLDPARMRLPNYSRTTTVPRTPYKWNRGAHKAPSHTRKSRPGARPAAAFETNTYWENAAAEAAAALNTNVRMRGGKRSGTRRGKRSDSKRSATRRRVRR